MKKLERINNNVILAEGEVTGHAHRVADIGVDLFERDNGERVIVSNEAFTVTHEEHLPLTVEEPGSYTVGIVREYDHLAEEARVVRD